MHGTFLMKQFPPPQLIKNKIGLDKRTKKSVTYDNQLGYRNG